MSYKACILLLLLSPTCHSQEKARPRTEGKFAQLNSEIQLMPSVPQQKAVPGKVSVEDLQLPPKAVRELLRSQKAFQSGDWRDSASHLEKVLAIAPQYWPAQNELGRLYVGLHEYDRAVSEFQKASANQPHSAVSLNNLSATLFLLRRYPEAESVARATLDLDPAQAETHYILGSALVAQERFTIEAEQHLRLSTSSIPIARLLLASLLSRRGARDEAAAELRAYLQIPDAPEKQLAQSALAQLTRIPANPINSAAPTPH
jgi:tetratricopeptide (TPR) repeat protein